MNYAKLTMGLAVASVIGLASAAHAAEDVAIISADKTIKLTIHTATVTTYKGKGDVTQSEAYVSYRTINEMERAKLAVTGCAKGQGFVGFLDMESGEPPAKPHHWVYGGDSMMDEVAEALCTVAGRNPQPAAKVTTKQTVYF